MQFSCTLFTINIACADGTEKHYYLLSHETIQQQHGIGDLASVEKVAELFKYLLIFFIDTCAFYTQVNNYFNAKILITNKCTPLLQI